MRANRLLLAGFCLVATVVTGCGGSGTTAANGKTDGENIVASVDDLPNCTPKREGNVLFVTEEDGNYQMQVCEDGIWKEMGQPLAVFESDDEFPNCTPSREGNEAYANSESTVYVCNDGAWTEKMGKNRRRALLMKGKRRKVAALRKWTMTNPLVRLCPVLRSGLVPRLIQVLRSSPVLLWLLSARGWGQVL